MWLLDVNISLSSQISSQCILKFVIEVPQKEIQNLVELVHFHPTISALGVTNELRKEERFGLNLLLKLWFF